MRATLALILLALTLSVSTPVNAQGQKIRLTGEKANVYYAEWSPDGQLIALAVVRESPAEQPSGVYLITPEGKEVARITENVEADDRLFRMEWSLDSQYIKCTIGPLVPFREITIIASREGKVLSHVKNEMPDNNSGWLPDSKSYWKIDNEGRHLLAIGLDGKEVKRFDGTLLPSTLVKQSSDGKLFIAKTTRGIVLIDANTFKTTATLSDSVIGEQFTDWSPDGKLVAVWVPKADSAIISATIFDSTGNQLQRFEIKAKLYGFRWSPNGKVLAGVILPGKNSVGDVLFYSIDGKFLGTAPLGKGLVDWAPDNTYLIANPDGGLVTIHPDGTLAHDFGFTVELHDNDYPPRFWSPDGKLLALYSPNSSYEDMFIFSVEGKLLRKFKRLWEGGWFHWSPDSKSLLLTEGEYGAWLYKVQ